MNGKEYAQRIGVPHGTIKRWLHEGMPAERGGHSHGVEIDVASADAWVRAHRPQSLSFQRVSVIYFAQREDLAIKVGWTSDVMRRVQELRKQQGCAVALLACVPGDKPDELRLHDRFAPHRLDTEWLAPHDDILAHLRSLGRSAA